MNSFYTIIINLGFMALLLVFYATSRSDKFIELSEKLTNLVNMTNVFLLGWSVAINKASSKVFLTENGIENQTLIESVQGALSSLNIYFTLPIIGPIFFYSLQEHLKERKQSIEAG